MSDLYPIPPRPEGGYPDEFFASWPQDDAKVWAHWVRSYHAATGGDPHNDFGRWLDKVAPATPATPMPMQQISVRLPMEMVARAEDEGNQRLDGRSGVIRDALTEHWSHMDNTK